MIHQPLSPIMILNTVRFLGLPIRNSHFREFHPRYRHADLRPSHPIQVIVYHVFILAINHYTLIIKRLLNTTRHNSNRMAGNTIDKTLRRPHDMFPFSPKGCSSQPEQAWRYSVKEMRFSSGSHCQLRITIQQKRKKELGFNRFNVRTSTK